MKILQKIIHLVFIPLLLLTSSKLSAEKMVFDEMLWAVISGDYQTVDVLLQMEFDSPDATDFRGYSLLHYAAAKNHVEIAKLLIQNQATIDPVSKDIFKFTPLYFAIAGRRYEMIKLLLENGADIMKVLASEKILQFPQYPSKFMEL